MKKAGKIVIGAYERLVRTYAAICPKRHKIYEKRRADRGRSEPDRRRPDTGDRKY